ncbi:MAG: methanethiol S-methyltransferase [Polyangiaceae bacterium]|jgi:methanethiol S-methyltransferase
MIGLAYGLLAYAVFFGTFVYTIGFVEGFVVPRTIDSGPPASLALALAVDCGWFVLFAIQHSGMARASFKRRWTRIVPARAERSTYVLVSALMLVLLVAVWRPIPTVVWRIDAPVARSVVVALSLAGWALVLLASFAIDHFELFGLRQVFDAARDREPAEHVFRTPVLYRVVRHPLYLGFLTAFWSTPTMSVGHLVFALGMTAYLFVGMHFEERDLVRRFGGEYRAYQQRVPALFPTFARRRLAVHVRE